jgi:hypothetical protein
LTTLDGAATYAIALMAFATAIVLRKGARPAIVEVWAMVTTADPPATHATQRATMSANAIVTMTDVTSGGVRV